MKKKNKKSDIVSFDSKEIKVKNIKSEDYKVMVTFIVLLVIMLIIFGGLYLLNGKYISKDLFQTTTTTTKEVKYDSSVITVDNMFDNNGIYYVLVYDGSDNATSPFYQTLINNYEKEGMNLYSIDLSNKFNSNYYNKDKEEKITNKEINFTRPVLVKIKDKKVISTEFELSKITSLLS